MLITDQNAITQALANVKLESLMPSAEILELLKNALHDGSVDTTYILDLMRG
jgi:hypothetical protein